MVSEIPEQLLPESEMMLNRTFNNTSEGEDCATPEKV